MPKRTESYDKMIADKLQDVNYAREYLIVLVDEEEMSVEEALITLAQKMGEKEFAQLTGTTKQKINDFVKGRRPASFTILNRYLEPFDLELDIGLKESS